MSVIASLELQDPAYIKVLDCRPMGNFISVVCRQEGSMAKLFLPLRLAVELHDELSHILTDEDHMRAKVD